MLKEIFNAERALLDSTLKTAAGDGDFASLPDQVSNKKLDIQIPGNSTDAGNTIGW